MLANLKRNKWVTSALTAFVLGVVMVEPAFAGGGDFFDRIGAINTKLPILKTFMIYIAFLLGLGAMIWAGTELVKLSKPDTRGEATWTGVLLKGVGGAILLALTLSSDTMQRTLFGSSSAAPGISYLSVPYDRDNA